MKVGFDLARVVHQIPIFVSLTHNVKKEKIETPNVYRCRICTARQFPQEMKRNVRVECYSLCVLGLFVCVLVLSPPLAYSYL